MIQKEKSEPTTYLLFQSDIVWIRHEPLTMVIADKIKSVVNKYWNDVVRIGHKSLTMTIFDEPDLWQVNHWEKMVRIGMNQCDCPWKELYDR